jgi:hypothetical protein
MFFGQTLLREDIPTKWLNQFFSYSQADRQAFLISCSSQMVHSPNGTFAKWHIRQMAHTPARDVQRARNKNYVLGFGSGYF